MFGAYRHFTQAYSQVATETGIAGGRPVDLVIMLYEGAIDALTRATAAPDRAARGASISRAIRILEDGLSASLDDSGGDITRHLRDLYAYMSRRLLTASLHGSNDPVEEVRSLLKDLLACWQEIAARPAAPARADARQSAAAGVRHA